MDETICTLPAELSGSTQRTDIPRSVKACKTRAILNETQALQIFQMKVLQNQTHLCKTEYTQKIADIFGVSEKAVRDIWKGRTWRRETMHLEIGCIGNALSMKLPGRPKGSKNACNVSKNTDSNIKRTVNSSMSATCAAQTNDLQSSSTFENSGHESLNEQMSRNTTTPSVQSITLSAPEEWTIPMPMLQFWGQEPAKPLPEPSNPDDPFHDDWVHWAGKRQET